MSGPIGTGSECGDVNGSDEPEEQSYLIYALSELLLFNGSTDHCGSSSDETLDAQHLRFPELMSTTSSVTTRFPNIS